MPKKHLTEEQRIKSRAATAKYRAEHLDELREKDRTRQQRRRITHKEIISLQRTAKHKAKKVSAGLPYRPKGVPKDPIDEDGKKICVACKEKFPATLEFFHKHTKKKMWTQY